MARFAQRVVSEMLELQRRVDELFEQARAQTRRVPSSRWLLVPVDVVATEDSYIVKADIPGVPAEDITVTAGDGVVTVRGKKLQAPDNGGRALRRERRYGEFVRPIPLPSDADFSKVEASLKSGVLTVKVGRRSSFGVRAVPVKDAGD
ncbi:MAG: Hsp20/alpha crystallin family protein [Armatimonadetes bacterium]|nr:Hsp20/alpha crystallin family protein [Armatimonadota bacterium]